MLTVDSLIPSLSPAGRLATNVFDAIICAPGFEDRTLALQRHLDYSGLSKVILIDYEPNNPENRLPQVLRDFGERGVPGSSSLVIRYNRFDPGLFEDQLKTAIHSAPRTRLLVDISTMSKLLIMLVLNVASQLNCDVTIFYAEAERYHPTEGEFEFARETNRVHQPSLQIFTGVHGVVRVDSLASVAMQGQQTAAIIFMSFNDALTQVILNSVYPGRLLLINGRPPIHGWREKATAWIHDQVRREWPEDNPTSPAASGELALPRRVVSTLDYRETVALLIELYWQLSATNRILLAPAGSKMQTVGCSIVRALHPDIHIEYPSPDGFSPEYSSGIGDTWTLVLGNLSHLLSKIRQLERTLFLKIPVISSDSPA